VSRGEEGAWVNPSWTAACAHRAHSLAAAATLFSARASRRLLDVLNFQSVGVLRPDASPPRRWYIQACSAAPLSRFPTQAPK